MLTMIMKHSIHSTGGAGYIGSHPCLALIETDSSQINLDDFANTKPTLLARLRRITSQPIEIQQGSMVNMGLIYGVIECHQITAVIHFAGLKAVGECLTQPLRHEHVAWMYPPRPAPARQTGGRHTGLGVWPAPQFADNHRQLLVPPGFARWLCVDQ